MIELFYDEALATQNAAWFWRGTNDTPDDPAVGPYRSRDEAENAARLYYRSIGESFPGVAPAQVSG